MKRTDNTLTEKERMFCEEYIVDLDATQAAIRAGYSADSAKSIAYHLKQRPQVEAYITELLEKRRLRLRITADEVLLELAKIAFSEPADFTSPQATAADLNANSTTGGNLIEGAKTVDDTPGEAPVPPAPRYSNATMYKVTDVDPITGRRSVRWFSLPAKIAALRLLGRHLGLFGVTGKAMPQRPNIILPPLYPELLEQKAA